MTPKAVPSYRDDIDGLRSIAVLLVVLFHFNLTKVLAAGFIGVDMFFVVSGFLIVPAVLQQAQVKSFRFGKFYAKRIRRLAPPLVATTVLTLAVATLVLTPFEFKAFAKEASSAQLYASNLYYWRFLNYFGLQADGSFFLHTWSLAVEEQFYLVFPLLLWTATRLLPRHTTLVLVAVLFGSFALNVVAIQWKPEATFYLLPTRAWEFAAGALTPQLAVLTSRWRLRPSWLAVAGLGLLGLTLATHDPTIVFPGVFAVLPVAATVLLLIAGADVSGWWSWLMSQRLPVYIGRISYELYLVHWPVRVFAPILILEYSLGARLATLAICFPLAAAIYHFTEVPVRSRRILADNRKLVLAYASATGGLLAVCAIVIWSDGLPGRLGPASLALAARADDADTTFRQCENRFDAPCVIGEAGKRPSWIVYGDSHADALASAFGDVLRNRRASGYFIFQSGCLPLLDSGSSDCRYFNRRISRLIDANPEIRDVAIISTWRQPLERGYTDTAGRAVDGKLALDAFRLNMRRTIAARTANFRRLAIWLPVPGARRSVPATLARNDMLGRNWNIAYSFAEHENRFAFLMGELARHPDVTLIRPARRICASGFCRVAIAGRPLYHDDAHPAGSQRPYFRAIIADDLPPPR